MATALTHDQIMQMGLDENNLPAGYYRADSGGSNDVSGAFARTLSLSNSDINALKGLNLSNINYNDFETKAKTDMQPYYESILKDANYDIDLAKQRLEEDYKRGNRQGREDAITQLNDWKRTAETDNRSMYDSLNQRGLLTTRTGNNQQGINATVQPDQKNNLAGIDITANPYTRTQFGGVAGGEIQRGNDATSARAEAIKRAMSRQEEQAGITYNRGTTDQETQRTRQTRDINQQKTRDIASLADSRYQRAINETQLKRNTILEPYQAELSGISGMPKYGT